VELDEHQPAAVAVVGAEVVVPGREVVFLCGISTISDP
jgi:hypothetical protein